MHFGYHLITREVKQCIKCFWQKANQHRDETVYFKMFLLVLSPKASGEIAMGIQKVVEPSHSYMLREVSEIGATSNINLENQSTEKERN